MHYLVQILLLESDPESCFMDRIEPVWFTYHLYIQQFDIKCSSALTSSVVLALSTESVQLCQTLKMMVFSSGMIYHIGCCRTFMVIMNECRSVYI